MRPARVVLSLALVGAAMLLTHPAAAAVGVEVNGFACGLATQPNPSPQEAPHIGYVTGGPVSVTADGGPAQATLRCSVQRFDPTYGSGLVVAQAYANGSGVVYLPPTGVSFRAYVGESVYICSELFVPGHPPIRLDSDPRTEGDQCETSKPQDTPLGPGYTSPPPSWHEVCQSVIVDGKPYDVCTPWPDGVPPGPASQS